MVASVSWCIPLWATRILAHFPVARTEWAAYLEDGVEAVELWDNVPFALAAMPFLGEETSSAIKETSHLYLPSR